jgi:hypothetical protein
MIRLVTSDDPSVCKRKAELIHSFVPDNLNNSRYTLLVNTGSLSLTIDMGKP